MRYWLEPILWAAPYEIGSCLWIVLKLFVIRKAFGSGKSVCYLKIKKNSKRNAASFLSNSYLESFSYQRAD